MTSGAWPSVFGSWYVSSAVASEAAEARICKLWGAGGDGRVPSHVVTELRDRFCSWTVAGSRRSTGSSSNASAATSIPAGISCRASTERSSIYLDQDRTGE